MELLTIMWHRFIFSVNFLRVQRRCPLLYGALYKYLIVIVIVIHACVFLAK